MDKILPNRRAITVSIMKSANLDEVLTGLKKNVGEEYVARLLNAEIAGLYKGVTDSAFFLGKTIARILDPKNINSEEDMKEAVERLNDVLALMESFHDGVRTIMKNNKDFTFDDIVKDLDIEIDGDDALGAGA